MIGLELLEVTTGVVGPKIGAFPTRPVPMTGAFPTPRKTGTREVPAPEERTGTNGKMTSGPRVGEAKMRNGTSGRILD